MPRHLSLTSSPRTRQSHPPTSRPRRPIRTTKLAPAAVESTETADGPYVTPLVRKLAAEHGIDLSSVTGTGVGGRIRKQDILTAAALQRGPAVGQPAVAQPPAAQPAAAQAQPALV